MGPVVTIMMGRIEDWLRVQTERDGIVADPAALPWSGVAVFKRAYGLFRERGYRARLLGAAIRHHYHWSELIGGDVVITMPAVWQRRFNDSAVEVRPRIDDPVDPAIVAELSARFPDFVRAYEPDGLARRRVRRVPGDRADAPGVHRLVPRAAPPRDRRGDPQPGRSSVTDAGPAADARLHRRAGELATGPWDLALAPDEAGWSFSGLRVATLPAGGEIAFDTGPDEVAILPLAGCVQRRLRRLGGRARRAEQRLRRPDRLRLRAARQPAHRLERGRRAVRGARGPGGPRAPVPPRGRPPTSGSSCAAPAACRARSATSPPPDAFDAERLIAVEVLTPERQLVARTRRTSTTRRDRARPCSRRSTSTRSRPGLGRRRRRVPAGVRDAGPADRRPRRGPIRRRRPDPARLARAGDGARRATTSTT